MRSSVCMREGDEDSDTLAVRPHVHGHDAFKGIHAMAGFLANVLRQLNVHLDAFGGITKYASLGKPDVAAGVAHELADERHLLRDDHSFGRGFRARNDAENVGETHLGPGSGGVGERER